MKFDFEMLIVNFAFCIDYEKMDLPLLANCVHMEDGKVLILDETQLPEKVEYIIAGDYEDIVKAIKEMRTRAFGQVLATYYAMLLALKKKRDREAILKELERAAKALEESRPTFPFKSFTRQVLLWAKESQEKDLAYEVEGKILKCIEEIHEARWVRAKMASGLLKNGATVLTHCNVSGEMVMIGKASRKEGKTVKFIVTETRPYFQGSRLTAWELSQAGFPLTLICDNAVGYVLSQAMVNAVIVGSDRCARNGDVVNKVGTFQIALLAKEYGVPFYVLAQPSWDLEDGRKVEVEERVPRELLEFRDNRIAPEGIEGYYPAFDVTPAQYVTKWITFDRIYDLESLIR